MPYDPATPLLGIHTEKTKTERDPWSPVFIAAAAAAAAKLLQSCPTLWPHRWQPTRLPVSGILKARTLEWVAISFSNAWKWKMNVKSLSRVRLLATPWTAAYQAPLSMGFSRQKYWSGFPLPSPVHCSTIHSGHGSNRCPSADEWIRKLWYTYLVEYYSPTKRNAFESVLMRWMKLESIIQSEVKKRKTNTVY